MSTFQKLKAYVVAGGLIVLAIPTLANAAIVAPAHDGFSGARPEAVQVHWEYRHHHRYWVPDRRHDDHRDDRR